MRSVADVCIPLKGRKQFKVLYDITDTLHASTYTKVDMTKYPGATHIHVRIGDEDSIISLMQISANTSNECALQQYYLIPNGGTTSSVFRVYDRESQFADGMRVLKELMVYAGINKYHGGVIELGKME